MQWLKLFGKEGCVYPVSLVGIPSKHLSLIPLPARDKGQGTRDKGQGTRDKGQGTREEIPMHAQKALFPSKR